MHFFEIFGSLSKIETFKLLAQPFRIPLEQEKHF